MYGGMEETYGIRVLYSGLESRRYIGLSSCQFLLLSPTVSAYEDLYVSTSTGEQGPCVRITNIVRGVSRLNDTEKNSMDRHKDDMHESRNVVKFFFLSSGISQWPRQVPSGPQPIHLCGVPAGLSFSPRALRGPYCEVVGQFVFFLV